MSSKIKKAEINIRENFATVGSTLFSDFEHATWLIQEVYLHDLSAWYALLDHIKTVNAATIKKHPGIGWWAVKKGKGQQKP